MTLKVLKFGGSSLADAEHYQKVANIIKSEEARRYIVASAPGKRYSGDEKVTDLLYKSFKLASENAGVGDVFEKIENRYNKIIEDLGITFNLEEKIEEIAANVSSQKTADYLLSRGEYLNAMILAKYLDFEFIDAREGIFFFQDGTLDVEKTNLRLREILANHRRAVIPGFYGALPDGTIKTFSRGGSDITGAIVARAVNADIYENWTDVSGLMVADPRYVDNPKPIDKITYKELRELSYMGATVLHEDALFPVKKTRIPVNIKNTNEPAAKGTMIVSEIAEDNAEHIITGIAGKVGFSSINIEKDMMNSEIGFGMKVLEVLRKYGISFEHIPTGIDTMSVVVNTSSIIECKEAVIADLNDAVRPDHIEIEDGIAMIAIVGRSMIKSKSIAARIFRALAAPGINIKLIDQGSSRLNIIIGIDENDYILALKSIYGELIEKEQ
ncbi:MAG: aspartate kinase [Eubacteriales bacterium]|nr:aspartate kinase [Eubacteriales bacterium]MDD4390973.1 aspartate kinase [Eubacteriales bacterium]